MTVDENPTERLIAALDRTGQTDVTEQLRTILTVANGVVRLPPGKYRVDP